MKGLKAVMRICRCLLASVAFPAAAVAGYAEPHFTLTLRKFPADKEVVVASSNAVSSSFLAALLLLIEGGMSNEG